ncbi:hypothetical protein GCM10027612_60630 [Microbispora bryophytorum subsp. camponoti]
MESYFDGRAAGYGHLSWHTGYAERLVELAGLTPGMRVLDAATGTGLAALAAARAVGPSGQVVGVDISAGMLQEADRLCTASGLTNVGYVKADATALDGFGDEAFDVVLCCAGMLYLPASTAFAAWHRVLKPGGLVCFSAMRAGFPARLACSANAPRTSASPSPIRWPRWARRRAAARRWPGRLRLRTGRTGCDRAPAQKRGGPVAGPCGEPELLRSRVALLGGNGRLRGALPRPGLRAVERTGRLRSTGHVRLRP